MVSDKGKGADVNASGKCYEGERKRTIDEVSKFRFRRCQNWKGPGIPGKVQETCFTAWAASGMKMARL